MQQAFLDGASVSTGASQSDQPSAHSKWLPYCRWQADPKLRLVCFAHAGGSAMQFRAWERKLPRAVQICAVQLPGRENRLHEQFITRIPPLIDELASVLSPLFDRPVAVLGHSLGATIGFEFVRRMREGTYPGEVVHFFASGAPAPHLASRKPPCFNLPHDEFIQTLEKFGGTPLEILRSPELLEFFLPRLRADLELNETYDFTAGPPLDVPISAFGGEADPETSPEAIRAWGERTTLNFRCCIVPGGHFFLYDQIEQVLPLVVEDLLRYL